jgi:hypothetical protein
VKWQVSQRQVEKSVFAERKILEDLVQKETEKTVTKVLERHPPFAEHIKQDQSLIDPWAKQIGSQCSGDLMKQLGPMFVEKYSLTSLSKLSSLRAGFDFFLPIPISLYAIYCLWMIKLPVNSFWCLHN